MIKNNNDNNPLSISYPKNIKNNICQQTTVNNLQPNKTNNNQLMYHQHNKKHINNYDCQQKITKQNMSNKQMQINMRQLDLSSIQDNDMSNQDNFQKIVDGCSNNNDDDSMGIQQMGMDKLEEKEDYFIGNQKKLNNNNRNNQGIIMRDNKHNDDSQQEIEDFQDFKKNVRELLLTQQIDHHNDNNNNESKSQHQLHITNNNQQTKQQQQQQQNQFQGQPLKGSFLRDMQILGKTMSFQSTCYNIYQPNISLDKNSHDNDNKVEILKQIQKQNDTKAKQNINKQQKKDVLSSRPILNEDFIKQYRSLYRDVMMEQSQHILGKFIIDFSKNKKKKSNNNTNANINMKKNTSYANTTKKQKNAITNNNITDTQISSKSINSTTNININKNTQSFKSQQIKQLNKNNNNKSRKVLPNNSKKHQQIIHNRHQSYTITSINKKNINDKYEQNDIIQNKSMSYHNSNSISNSHNSHNNSKNKNKKQSNNKNNFNKNKRKSKNHNHNQNSVNKKSKSKNSLQYAKYQSTANIKHNNSIRRINHNGSQSYANDYFQKLKYNNINFTENNVHKLKKIGVRSTFNQRQDEQCNTMQNKNRKDVVHTQMNLNSHTQIMKTKQTQIQMQVQQQFIDKSIAKVQNNKNDTQNFNKIKNKCNKKKDNMRSYSKNVINKGESQDIQTQPIKQDRRRKLEERIKLKKLN